jgi:hypothetical protein
VRCFWPPGYELVHPVGARASWVVRPAAARYNERTGSWEMKVIKDTWLPLPPGALAPMPSPDGNHHVRRE